MNSPSRSNGVAWLLGCGTASSAAAAALAMTGFAVPAAGLALVGALAAGAAILPVLSAFAWIDRTARFCRSVAGGDFEQRLVRLPARGAMRELAIATNALVDVTDAFLRESGASMTHISANQYWRRVVVTGLAGAFRQQAEIINGAAESIERKVAGLKRCAEDFEAGAAHVVQTVASAASELQVTTEATNDTVLRASRRTAEIAASSRVTSENVQTVSSAAEELTASVAEIAQHIVRSASTAQKGVEEARQARETVGQLASAADRIGDAIRLINDIASQTNLLALNATIEAARAGDAGKGFAVVATEVKHLAGQTATATEEITAHITAIRDTAEQVRQAIEEVDRTIQEMHGNSAAIEATIAQQRQATDEIARNMQQAADSAVSISSGLQDVSGAAETTGEATHQTLAAASELAREAERLRHEVDNFLAAVRTAA